MHLKQLILDQTEGGKTILMNLFPHFDQTKQFKAEDDEKSASAKAKLKGTEWTVAVYDGGRAPTDGYLNAIDWYMYKNNYHDFVDAMKAICAEYGIITENKTLTSNTVMIDEKRDYTGFRTNIVTRDVNDAEAKTIGKYVTPTICKQMHVKYVESYDYTDKNGITRRTTSSEINPHFLLELEGKIYAPKAPDARYRYMATRSMDDAKGKLWMCDEVLKEIEHDVHSDDEDDLPAKATVIIACGYRDAINIFSLGHHVVWMSSEGMDLPQKKVRQLQKYADVYYCADLDSTGQDQAHKACDRNLDIFRIYLPSWLKEKKDFRGKACKDITDFIKHSGKDLEAAKSSFDILLRNASPYRFWIETKDKDGNRKNRISRTYVKRFLEAYGFRGFKFDDGKGFIKITGNCLEKVDQDDIKSWVNRWAYDRGFGRSILDMISGTRDLSPAVLSELPIDNPKVITASAEHQDIFFENEVWRITANDIRSLKQGNVDSYVWKHKIGSRETGQVVVPKIKGDVFRPQLKRKMVDAPDGSKMQSPDKYFQLEKIAGRLELKIFNKAPQWFRFLINTCKVHWKKEVKSWAEKNGKEGTLGYLQKLYAETDYCITSPFLSEEENREQVEHLMNRLYTMGYLMHRHKFRGNSLLVWCMDYKAESLKDSKGRSGKSIIPQAFTHLKTSATVNGRDDNLTKQNHLFGDVTSYTDLLIINDVHTKLDLGFFFNYVTDDISVNPKNVSQRTIPFDQAGKVIVTSNYSPEKLDDSTLDRLLFNLFSDWYHSDKDFGVDHRPQDDFKCLMFDDWNNAEWNEFFNFMAQCCMVSLSLPKIQAPMNQVNLRAQMREAGDAFIEWADETLLQIINSPILDVHKNFPDDPSLDGLVHEEPGVGAFIIKAKAKELYDKYNNPYKIQMNNFTKKIKVWCEMRQITLNPDRVMPTSNRMVKTVMIDGKKKQAECIYLSKGNENQLTETPIPL